MSEFREVAGSRKFRAWKEYAEGDTVTGIFTEEYKDNYGKTARVIQVESFEFDDNAELNLEVGQNLVLNANGGLDFKMDGVEIGSTIKVVYEGQDVMTKGIYKGKKYHKVAVFVKDGIKNNPATPNTDEDQDVL